MSLDLTYYEDMYATKKQGAILIATGLIKEFHENMPEYNLNYKMQIRKDMQIRKGMETDGSKEHLDSVLDIVDGIMYSSGFFTDHKITKYTIKGVIKLHVVHTIMLMTPEEKETQITSKLIDANMD